MKKTISKVFSFLMIVIIVGYYLNMIFTPNWYDWNNDNTVKGFYEEPDNTVQVLFLGTSQYVTGISPIYLYRNYGICSYDSATEQQPLLSSYFWLQEAYKHHSETLKTVFLEMSAMNVRETQNNLKMWANEKALIHMRWSSIKYNALKACAEQYGEDFKLLDYILPLARYHSRWSGLGEDDFRGITHEKNYFFTRGQMVNLYANMGNAMTTNYSITDSRDHTVEDFEEVWDENNLNYLNKIVDYCKERNIKLIISQLPRDGWSDLTHDEIDYLAEKYGVPFLDLNLPEIQKEMDIDFTYDDGGHPSFYGAEKYTNYLGKYIVENCDVRDVRGDIEYDYLKKQSEEYETIVEDSLLKKCKDFKEYLQLIDKDRYTVYVSARDDAATSLDEESRELIKRLGFTQLSDLGYRMSYIGIRDRGHVILDVSGNSLEERLTADGNIYEKQNIVNEIYHQLVDDKGKLIVDEDFILLNGPGYFSIRSAGLQAGNISSIIINGTEYSKMWRGINIVVYDNTYKRIVDTCTFDTYAGMSRSTDASVPDSYIRRDTNAKLSAELTLDEYIAEAMGENRTIVIMNCPIADRNREESTKYFTNFNLDSVYAGVMRDSRILREYYNLDDINISEVDTGLANYSIEVNHNHGALTIGGTKYEISPGMVGILTYDGTSNTVLNFKTFDYNKNKE